MNQKEAYVGQEARDKRGILRLKCPIQAGMIMNWEDLEKIWCHIFFNELQVAVDEHPVLLTDTPSTPKPDREKMVQIMFESFVVPAFCVCNQSVLSLYASGETTGLIVDCGHDLTSAIPVVEGNLLTNAIDRRSFTNIGGNALTDYLMKILMDRGYAFVTRAEHETLGVMKEDLTYVAFDLIEERRKLTESPSELEKRYELPDGTVLALGSERFQCPEPLFQPDLIPVDHSSVQKLVVDNILKCDGNLRNSLFSKIILTGGSTMIPGFAERLQKEVSTLLPADEGAEVNVFAQPNRRYSSWIGGSILTSRSTFRSMCVSKSEYEEVGPAIVHRKCTN
jgi:actin